MPAIVFRIFYRILQFNRSRMFRSAKVVVYNCTRLGIVLAFWLVCPILLPAQYRLHIKPIDKDSVFIYTTLRLQSSFKNADLAGEYLANLPALLQSKGYPAASVDSVFNDSL